MTRCTLVLDTETTGLLEHSYACLVEIGAVVVSPSGSIVARWGSLIRPSIDPPPEADEALTVNGLDRAGLAVAPPWQQVRGDLLRWVMGLDYVAMFSLGSVTSFNKQFDKGMVDRQGGLGPLDRLWGDCIQLDAGRKLHDPKAATRRAPGRPPLSWVASELGIEQTLPAHRAVSDAETAARVMVALRSRSLR